MPRFPGLTLAALLALLVALPGVMAGGYDMGGEDPICWITFKKWGNLTGEVPAGTSLPSRTQTTCPTGTTVKFISGKPTEMYSQEYEIISYTMTVDFDHLEETIGHSAFPLVAPFSAKMMIDVDDDANDQEIGHANVHSCASTVGFCVPFIGNDGELATHSAALSQAWTWSATDTNTAEATFDSEVALYTGSYSIIAHGRFEFYDTDGNEYRMDLADAFLGVNVYPLKSEIKLADGALVVGQVVIILSLVFLTVMLILVFVKRKHKIIKLSQGAVLINMIIAGIVADVWMLMFMHKVDDTACGLKLFVTVPLTYMVGLLFGKVCRVHKLTQRKKLGKVKISVYFVSGWAVAVTIPQLLIQVMSLVMDPPKAYEFIYEDDIRYQMVCESDSSDTFVIIMLLVSFAILIMGSYAAHLSSKLASAFNEAAHISTAMYTIALLSFVTVPVGFAVGEDPSALYVVATLAICLSVNVTLALLVGPKIKLIMAGVKVAAVSQVVDVSQTQGGVTTTGGGPEKTENGTLKPQVRNLFKKGDMKEDAMRLCDVLHGEVGTVKGKYDNMFSVQKEDMQKVLDAVDKFLELAINGDVEIAESGGAATTGGA